MKQAKADNKWRECPFCGSDDTQPVRTTDEQAWYVRCNDCLANGPMTPGREAIAAWNHRQPKGRDNE